LQSALALSLAALLGESFLSSEYCRRAFTHRSVSADNNERLEYLGDSLLGFFIAEWLYKKFPSYSEGSLTRLRAHLVRKETLAEIAREQKLAEMLKLGSGELKSGGLNRASILADALEAVIGAVYLAEGLQSAKDFVLNIYANKFENIPTVDELKDAKTRLQELLQSRGLSVPVYELKEKHGKSGKETFVIQCLVEGSEEIFSGTGASRRKAEQQVAEVAYQYFLDLYEN